MKEQLLSLVQLRPKRQLTVPESVAAELKLSAGDYLEARAEDNRLVFTIKTVSDRVNKIPLRAMLGQAKGAFASASEADEFIADGRADR